MAGDLGLLVAGLAVSIASSFVLARELDRVGVRLGVTEGLLGILTALGADAPEISTAAVAVLTHKPDIGVGVVLGSNVFNLAGLLGLGAVVAGQVRIGRQAALLEGSAAIAVAALAVAVAEQWVPPIAGLVLVTAVIAPYAWLASARPEHVARLPGVRLKGFLTHAVRQGHRAARPDHLPAPATAASWLLLPVAVALVIGASIAVVHAADGIGKAEGISQGVMGTLVLAVATSIPNVVAALRLALHHRGSAVVSEAYNSNTANVLGGLCIPAAILGLGAATQLGRATAVSALGMTVLSVVLLARSPGLVRSDGIALIAAYGAFVLLVLHLA